MTDKKLTFWNGVVTTLSLEAIAIGTMKLIAKVNRNDDKENKR